LNAGTDTLVFLSLLWKLGHALQSASKAMLARQGVTGPQRLVLRLVGLNPDIVAGDLARALHQHPSTLTGVLQRLEGRGLLVRDVDPEDRRRTRVSLTSSGQAIDQLREGTIEAAAATALASLSPEDIATTTRTLSVITRAIMAEFQ
jgi:DNA-binding MarR family transcriptional regulator